MNFKVDWLVFGTEFILLYHPDKLSVGNVGIALFTYQVGVMQCLAVKAMSEDLLVVGMGGLSAHHVCSL